MTAKYVVGFCFLKMFSGIVSENSYNKTFFLGNQVTNMKIMAKNARRNGKYMVLKHVKKNN